MFIKTKKANKKSKASKTFRNKKIFRKKKTFRKNQKITKIIKGGDAEEWYEIYNAEFYDIIRTKISKSSLDINETTILIDDLQKAIKKETNTDKIKIFWNRYIVDDTINDDLKIKALDLYFENETINHLNNRYSAIFEIHNATDFWFKSNILRNKIPVKLKEYIQSRIDEYILKKQWMHILTNDRYNTLLSDRIELTENTMDGWNNLNDKNYVLDMFNIYQLYTFLKMFDKKCDLLLLLNDNDSIKLKELYIYEEKKNIDDCKTKGRFFGLF